MNVVIALLPVLLMLALLQLMDSFKLVRITSVLTAIATGALVAILCLTVHGWLIDVSGLNLWVFERYVSPITEEALKASFVAAVLWQGRVGFLVDAAVLGFGVGAGFALVENVDYLRHLVDAPVALWLVRGFGTAVLHGATTAVFAMVSKMLVDRSSDRRWLTLVPGLAVAIAIHSAFNHLPLRRSR